MCVCSLCESLDGRGMQGMMDTCVCSLCESLDGRVIQGRMGTCVCSFMCESGWKGNSGEHGYVCVWFM